MAQQEKAPDAAARSQLREFRRVLANVVDDLRSAAVSDTYAAITLNEVIDQHLQELVGEGRVPSRMQRVKTSYEEFKSSIEAIKAIPPSAFRLHDPKNDVNTAP
jgi:hypothetical protein